MVHDSAHQLCKLSYGPSPSSGLPSGSYYPGSCLPRSLLLSSRDPRTSIDLAPTYTCMSLESVASKQCGSFKLCLQHCGFPALSQTRLANMQTHRKLLQKDFQGNDWRAMDVRHGARWRMFPVSGLLVGYRQITVSLVLCLTDFRASRYLQLHQCKVFPP
jgi:hypothetical protein